MKSILSIHYLIVLLLLSCCSNLSPERQLSPRVNHVMLYVSNLDNSINFYTKAFDLKVTNRLHKIIAVQEDGSEVERTVNMAFLKFSGQDFVFELAEHARDTTGINNAFLFQHMGIDVIDIDVAYKRALDQGGEPLRPVRIVKANGIEAKQAFIGGPDGERIELMQIISGEF